MIKTPLLLFLLILIGACNNVPKKVSGNPFFELDFEYIGNAIQKEGYHIWGSSPVIGRDGKIHLYVSEWPIPEDKSERFSGWYKHCSIAHYVGESPEGPFKYIRTAVKDLDGDFNSPHNPTIQFINNKYVLCFIVNENNDLSKQRIIMYVSDSLEDEWSPAIGAEVDGTILRASSDDEDWNHDALLGVSNPSLIKHEDKFMLYYKSVVPLADTLTAAKTKGRDYGYGLAVAQKLEGPYKNYPKRVTAKGIQLEDVYAFELNNEVCLLSRDFRGVNGSPGGGLLWRSEDGLYFGKEKTKRAYEGLSHYVGEKKLKQASVFRGTAEGQLERPQLLIIDGKPRYMYVATGVNCTSGYGSTSHVFKVKIDEQE